MQERRCPGKRHTFTRVACLSAVLLACCARSGPDELGLAPVALRDLPGWQVDWVAEAMPALLKSCQHADTLSNGQPVPDGQSGAVRAGSAVSQLRVATRPLNPRNVAR
jgi:hypothetical protein